MCKPDSRTAEGRESQTVVAEPSVGARAVTLAARLAVSPRPPAEAALFFFERAFLRVAGQLPTGVHDSISSNYPTDPRLCWRHSLTDT